MKSQVCVVSEYSPESALASYYLAITGISQKCDVSAVFD